MMLIVASTLVLLAATAPAPRVHPPSSASGPPARGESLRHYAQARLLEERGETEAAVQEYYRALVGDPGSGSIARHISELAARQGDPDRSLEFAKRALNADSSDARALWLRGLAEFEKGSSEAALHSLEAATRGDSTNVDYLQALGHVAEQMDRPAIEELALRRLVDVHDEDAEAWFHIAALAARRGGYEEADRALDRAVALDSHHEADEFLRGCIAEGLGRDSAAADHYRRHLAGHGSDQATRRRLVSLLARQERFAEAYDEAGRVSRASPNDAGALLVQTELAFRAGDVKAGRDIARELERTHAEDFELQSRLVGIEARGGHPDDAEALASRWNAAHPGDVRGALLESRAALAAGRGQAALERAREAVRLAPDSVDTYEMVGRSYQSLRRWDLAESLWIAAGRRFPDNADLQLQLGYCREQRGDLAGALAVIRDLLKREPANAEALNSLGYMLADHSRDLTEAESLIRRAVEQEPENGAFVDSMGWVLYRLGRLSEARAQLERAVALTGGDPVVCEHLGDVYKDLKFNELSKQLYRRSLLRDASNSRVREKLEHGR